MTRKLFASQPRWPHAGLIVVPEMLSPHAMNVYGQDEVEGACVSVGAGDGHGVGERVGGCVGTGVGCALGSGVGSTVGRGLGCAVGKGVGKGVPEGAGVG